MPYEVRGKCVYKKDTGKKVGCTKGSIKKYLAALHANVEEQEDETLKITKSELKRIIKEEVTSTFGEVNVYTLLEEGGGLTADKVRKLNLGNELDAWKKGNTDFLYKSMRNYIAEADKKQNRLDNYKKNALQEGKPLSFVAKMLSGAVTEAREVSRFFDRAKVVAMMISTAGRRGE